jgi:hypothetical protein
MKKPSGLLPYFGATALAVACNAVLGLEERNLAPPPDATGANPGTGGTSGSGTSGGAAGENSGGEAGAAPGDCLPGDEQSCRTVYPTLLGNCSRGTVRCGPNATWGACSIEPDETDSCDDEGDDADCDGTPNGGCPCLSGETRRCGPDTDEGICEFGTSICENETWAPCEGSVLPQPRDCQSSDDNDCDGESDDSRDAECPCASGGTHQCVSDAPADWSGPMALATASATASSPSCSATGYERQILSLLGALDEGGATCDCACSEPASMSCPSTVEIRRRSVGAVPAGCVFLSASSPDYTVSSGSCTGTLTDGYYYGSRKPEFSSGNCTPLPSTDIDAARWTRRMVACETNDREAAGCESGAQCLPDLVSPLEAWCIYRAGTHECPTGPYDQRTIYYEDFQDGRACSTCTCGAPSGTCEGYVDFMTGAGCGTTRVERVDLGGCYELNNGPAGVKAAPGPVMPEGECAPSGGVLQGSVQRIGAVTVCCMQ